MIADLAQFYPGLPTEDEFEDELLGVSRELFKARDENADIMIERAIDLAVKLQAAQRIAWRHDIESLRALIDKRDC